MRTLSGAAGGGVAPGNGTAEGSTFCTEAGFSGGFVTGAEGVAVGAVLVGGGEADGSETESNAPAIVIAEDSANPGIGATSPPFWKEWSTADIPLKINFNSSK